MRHLKRWFNRRYPYYRKCLVDCCWRGQVYDHRCDRHQGHWQHLPRSTLPTLEK